MTKYLYTRIYYYFNPFPIKILILLAFYEETGFMWAKIMTGIGSDMDLPAHYFYIASQLRDTDLQEGFQDLIKIIG